MRNDDTATNWDGAERQHLRDEAPPPNKPIKVNVPIGPMHGKIEGIPSSVVVTYTDASETIAAKLSQKFAETIGKLGEYYLVKNPYGNLSRSGASIVYVETDSKDMPECAQFARYELLAAAPHLEQSVRVLSVIETDRPSMPPYEDGISAVWQITGLTNGPHAVSSSFKIVETGVPIREIATRGPEIFASSTDRGPGREKRAVWIYLP